MIGTSKQYTYNDKPVRIYADGSDTTQDYIHGAYLTDAGWSIATFRCSDLVEVWKPKEGEIVWAWDDGADIPNLRKYREEYDKWDSFAQFKGELPEAFKGLEND